MTFGCSQSNSDPNASESGVFWDQLDSASWVDLPKESLPEWLMVIINQCEETYSKLSFFYFAEIFKGEWNKRNVFFLLLHIIRVYAIFIMKMVSG